MRYLLLTAALLAPVPAWAATGDVGCIEAKLGPVAMQRIGNGVVGATDNGSDPSRALDVDRDALLAARQACRAANNWSPDAAQIAVSYTQGRATRIGAEAALKTDGLDTATLSARYAALAVPDRKSLIEKASQRAVAAVRTSGADPHVRRHVLLYFAALAAIEFYPLDFTAA